MTPRSCRKRDITYSARGWESVSLKAGRDSGNAGEADRESLGIDEGVERSLRDLHALYRALRAQRERRGALDFDSREVSFRFDESGEVDGIIARQRNDAHKLIEECMVAANVEAAKVLEGSRVPTLFRVHASPPEQKLDGLRQSLAEIGLPLLHGGKDSTVTPSMLAKVLELAAERPDRDLIQALVLRSQSLAGR